MSGIDDWSESMRKLIRAYNDPPAPPADEMWDVISRRLAEEGEQEAEVPGDPNQDPSVVDLSSRRRSSRVAWWLRPSLAAAAILILGVALGRWSRPLSMEEPGPPAGLAAGNEASPGRVGPASPGFPAVAASYLQDTESFLTLLRADAREGRLNGGLETWAKVLLLQTRVLLDSPQAEDPGVRVLLEDLELVLVQVIQLPASEGDRGREELRWIDEGVEAHQVLPRVQAVIPAGPIVAGT